MDTESLKRWSQHLALNVFFIMTPELLNHDIKQLTKKVLMYILYVIPFNITVRKHMHKVSRKNHNTTTYLLSTINRVLVFVSF